jgi:hypothetical protein
MDLGVSGIDDMGNRRTVRLEMVRNQATMATPPERFGAHDCRRFLPRKLKQLFNSCFEIC